MARVTDGHVEDLQVLTDRRPGAILDPHPEGREAKLGVTGEREQVVDARQAERQADQLGAQVAVDRDRQARGAIPQVSFGHRRDCSLRNRRCGPA